MNIHICNITTGLRVLNFQSFISSVYLTNAVLDVIESETRVSISFRIFLGKSVHKVMVRDKYPDAHLLELRWYLIHIPQVHYIEVSVIYENHQPVIFFDTDD